jgi:hypothetical protein
MGGSKVEFSLSLTLSHRERELPGTRSPADGVSQFGFSLSLWERAGERGSIGHNTFMAFY